MAYKYIAVAVALCSCTLVATVCADGMTSSIPGAQTAAGVLASSAHGVARYFDQNGPIQPGVVAIGTLPARGAEQLNKGFSQLSSGLYNQAQRLSELAGQNGQIQMPGLQRTASQMPGSLSRMGQTLQDGIRRKNEWIMNRAQAGVDSANRLGERMRSSINDVPSVKATGPLSSAVERGESMLGNAVSSLGSGVSQLRNQAQQGFTGLRGQMAPVGSLGRDLAGQVQEYTSTLANGAQGVASQFRQTGQQLMSQVQNNHQRNMQTMSQLQNSLRSNLANLGRQARSFGRSAMQQTSGLAQNAYQQAQDTSRGAQDMSRNAIQQAENLGREAAQRAQTLGQGAARQAQNLSQSTAQQVENLGRGALNQAQNAAKRAQSLGEGALHQTTNLGQGAVHQAQNAARQLTDRIGSLAPSVN